MVLFKLYLFVHIVIFDVFWFSSLRQLVVISVPLLSQYTLNKILLYEKQQQQTHFNLNNTRERYDFYFASV